MASFHIALAMLVVTSAAQQVTPADARPHHHRVHHVRTDREPGANFVGTAPSRQYQFRPGYGYDAAGLLTYYGPNGTPYDPDIIGGGNHVGEGGPAVNFGGF